MQLSESTTNTGLLEDLRWWTDTNTTTYPTLDAYRNLNKAYQTLSAEALMSMDSWDFNGEKSFATLTANQQEYIWPSDIAKIKRVEVTYDGVDWHKAEPFDIQNTVEPLNNQSDINDYYSTSQPYYDVFDNSLFIYPVPTATVSNGICIWYETNIDELSSTTDTPKLPVQFHRLISMQAAYDFMLKKGMPALNNLKQEIEVGKLKMREFYNTRTQDEKPTLSPHYENYL